MANKYQQPALKNGQSGVEAKTQPHAPTPNPGVGAIPKGGAMQPKGQPPLTTKR